MALLTALSVADPADVWSALGFSVVDGAVWVDNVAHRLGCEGEPLSGWSLWGVTAGSSLDGIPTVVVDDPAEGPASVHDNGVVGLDHVVVVTPDHQRTIAAFEAAGIALKRVRDLGERQQAFFRLGPVIIELVGPTSPSGDGPASIMGLAWTCSDLAATGSWLGTRLRPPKDAVQPGRQIATLDPTAGSVVPTVFMSPEPSRV